MKLNWRWFLGGPKMLWISILLILIIISGIICTYIIDPTTTMNMRVIKDFDPSRIKIISESYLKECGITPDKPVVYRYVELYENNNIERTRMVTLGTFHEWNGKYYISISKTLYMQPSFEKIIIHETRHMLVQQLKTEKIIDLTKYTEEIAEGSYKELNDMFDTALKMLKTKQEVRSQYDPDKR